MAGDTRRHRRRGLHPAILLAAYLVVLFAPLALAWVENLPPRLWLDDLSSGLAMVAFAMLLVEFVLSGRFRPISGRMGIDITMGFHQLIARALLVFLLLHPFLYRTPLDRPLPWDPTRQLTLGLEGASLLTGVAAWLLLAVLVITAIARNRLPFSYEAWRLSHGLGAVLIAVMGTHHAIEAGRYSGLFPLTVFWLVLTGIALLSLLLVYLVTPLLHLAHPYRVASLRKLARKTWQVTLEPARGEAIAFEAGQFAWVTFDRSPFALREHPFSIASAPSQRPRLDFIIKESGDFTSTIGSLPVGCRAYVDGPHGSFPLAGRKDAPGLAFIAGGVGLVPILSLLRDLRAWGDRRPMVLIYGNRLADQIIQPEELESLQRSMNLTLHHVLSEPPADWCGARGQLDRQVLDRLLSDPERTRWTYFVCGPAPMIDHVETSLTGLGIPLRQVVSEKFSYG